MSCLHRARHRVDAQHAIRQWQGYLGESAEEVVVTSSTSTRFTLIFGVLIVAHAPIASAQAPAPPPEPPPRVEASAQFAFLDTRGNASTQSLGAGGEAIWRPAPWTYAAKAVFAQLESEDELSARSFAALFRASRALNARLSIYGQYDFLRDVFAGVEQRHITEAGVSYLVLETARHRLRADAGLGYLYERGPDEHFDSITLSPAAAYRFAISETSEFTYTPRFLLTLADGEAWKFGQEAALAVAINTFLSLKLAHTVRYSNAPPLGFDTTDTIMAISLVAKMKRS
jgi:putative salt-induced outer membrane protein YdiY